MVQYLNNCIKSHTFRTLFFSYLIIFIIPVVLLVTVQINDAYIASKKEIIDSYKHEAARTAITIDNKIHDVKSIGDKLFTKPWVIKLCSNTKVFDPEFDFIRKREISDELTIKSAGSIVSEMAVIFPYKDIVVSHHNWLNIDDYLSIIGINNMEDKSNIRASLFEYTPFCKFEQLNDIIEDNSIVLYQSLEGSAKPRAVVMFIIKRNTLNNYIANISPLEITDLSILGKNGQNKIVQFTSGINIGSDNIYTLNINSNILDWEYLFKFEIINIGIPFTKIYRIIITFVSMIIFGIIIAYLLSKITYRPLQKLLVKVYSYFGNSTETRKNDKEYNYLSDSFDTLVNEREQLKKREEQFKRAAQTDMLQRIIRGYFADDIEKRLSEYELDYKNYYCYSVIIIKTIIISKPVNIINKYILDVINNVEHILNQKSVSYNLIEMIDEDVVIILKYSNFVPDTDELIQLSNNLRITLNKTNDYNVIISEGSIEKGIIGISKSYHMAKENIQRRIFEENIKITRNAYKQNEMYYYPTDWEIQLINNLKTGNRLVVERILNEIKYENEKRKLSPHISKLLISRLIETFLRVISELNSDDSLILKDYNNLYFCKESKEQWKFLHKISTTICERAIYYNDSKAISDLGEQIASFINKNYSEPDLSLKMICEEYNVSTTTISKTFKEYAGVNYHEYVSRLRIEKAKELIRETEMNIAQIGKSIGYEHEFSFRRAFKRYEGINPEEYRKLILQ